MAADRPRQRPNDDLRSRPTRATASGLLVVKGRVLLERRPADARVSPGFWDSPGGHMEAGETPESTLLRELREELAIDVLEYALEDVFDAYEDPPGEVYRHFVYLVRRWRGEIGSASGVEIAWWTFDEVLKLENLNPRLMPVLARLRE